VTGRSDIIGILFLWPSVTRGGPWPAVFVDQDLRGSLRAY